MDTLWSLVERGKKCARRHRGKLIGVAVTGSVLYFGYQYLFPARKQSSRKGQESEKEMRSLFDMRREAYFQSSQEMCNKTILMYLEKLSARLDEMFEVNQQQLRNATSKATSQQDKMAVWEETKVNTFSRAATAIYGSTLLTLFVRVTVNMLSRYMYIDSIMAQEEQKSQDITKRKLDPISSNVQKKFLALSEMFLSQGIETLASNVKSHVKTALLEFPISKQCSFQDVIMMFKQIRIAVEGAPFLLTPVQFLLPNEKDSSITNDLQLWELVNETRDVFESNQFLKTFQFTIDEGFVRLIDEFRGLFESTVEQQSTSPSGGGVGSTPLKSVSKEMESRLQNMKSGGQQQEQQQQAPPQDRYVLHLARLLPPLKKQIGELMDTENNPNSFPMLLLSSELLQDYSHLVFQNDVNFSKD